MHPSAGHLFTASLTCSHGFYHAFPVLSVCIIQAPIVSVSSPYSTITPSSRFKHPSTAGAAFFLHVAWASSLMQCDGLYVCVMCTQPGWRQESAMMVLTQGVMGYRSTVGEWLHAASGCCSASLLSYKASWRRDSDLVGNLPPLSLCPAVALSSPLSLDSRGF